jgi:hypothetical protein
VPFDASLSKCLLHIFQRKMFFKTFLNSSPGYNRIQRQKIA